MGNKMKYHPHGSVLFCTFRIEEGLLLLANPRCHAIVKRCLAPSAPLAGLLSRHGTLLFPETLLGDPHTPYFLHIVSEQHAVTDEDN
jgi:hypothetical protein